MKKTPRILVVDDEPRMRESLETMLSMDGYSVSSAKDAREGLERLVSEPYDLAIIDLIMPGEDGRGLLKEIRERRMATRAIMFTGFGRDNLREELTALGAVELVYKPFEYETLKGLIERSLGKKG